MAARGRQTVILSSLPLQVLYYLNGWYFSFFWIAEALIFVYKGEVLPFPSTNLASEIVLLFLLGIIEVIRLFFGSKGNLTERIISMVVSILLCLPVLFTVLFFLLWQTYVLRAEVILCAILLVFLGLELILGVAAMVSFARAETFR
ncbi:TMEM216 [Branchiostoma lanceolatum]|uniref:TMEM216 protein n=1 Tax=Branchiostoma lanceolatum TaxID=7740 RepID=A0A8K0EF10_BRALA|nr:TMEM216 [Branchiostoma lanceolatum]